MNTISHPCIMIVTRSYHSKTVLMPMYILTITVVAYQTFRYTYKRNDTNNYTTDSREHMLYVYDNLIVIAVYCLIRYTCVILVQSSRSTKYIRMYIVFLYCSILHSDTVAIF